MSKLRPTTHLVHVINPFDVKIETLKIEKKELADKIAEIVGGFFTTAGRFDQGDTLYVNDNGYNDAAMFDWDKSKVAMFTVPHYPQPLFGKGVVVGTTTYGDEMDAETDPDWLLWNTKLVREFNPTTGQVIKSVQFATANTRRFPKWSQAGL